jgi:hypothetical protein
MTDNPLQKYVDAVDDAPTFIQPRITPRLAQYILKALDYLHIYAQKFDTPEIIEPEYQVQAEEIMTDIILEAPEELTNG